jgi:hypothetical protein
MLTGDDADRFMQRMVEVDAGMHKESPEKIAEARKNYEAIKAGSVGF